MLRKNRSLHQYLSIAIYTLNMGTKVGQETYSDADKSKRSSKMFLSLPVDKCFFGKISILQSDDYYFKFQ